MKSPSRELLEKWYTRIRAAHKAHYQDGARCARNQKRLGIIVVVLSSLIGTGVFASLAQQDTPTWLKIVAGFLSTLATVLAAVQTHLNYAEKQAIHLLAGTQLSSLKKRIQAKLVTAASDAELISFIDEVVQEWNAITSGAPLLSDDTFEQHIQKKVEPSAFDHADA